MAAPAPRILEVLDREQISPNMLRLHFGGAGVADFPAGCEGGYIKLMFPELPRANPSRPVMRTYSVRSHDPEAGRIAVDFALHGDSGGIATEWAMQAKPGDRMPVGGPGSIKMAGPGRDWYLLAGDMTGLPALLCNIDRLPPDARGYVVIEITTGADRQDLNLPEGMEVHWVINPTPDDTKGRLVDQVRALPWLEGDVFVWTACEFDSMRALRSYYRNDRGLARDQIYLSSYWRAGRTEDQHKVEKQKDSVADQAAG
jgi:NADPH-dependent ferric siderophore reductase